MKTKKNHKINVEKKIYDYKFYGYGFLIANVIMAIILQITDNPYWMYMIIGSTIMAAVAFIKVIYIEYKYGDQIVNNVVEDDPKNCEIDVRGI